MWEIFDHVCNWFGEAYHGSWLQDAWTVLWGVDYGYRMVGVEGFQWPF